ncbi:MAG: T9SS type A sorting domain-containing protein [Bacteroidaceae bacterium]|nr:T9SS type A sorting domain-containing protein [Bacteroidaceae bacterium]
MKKITIKKWLLACMTAYLWTNVSYAQDSLTVNMIRFEYDDSGSIVLEEIVGEKEEADDSDELEALLEQEELTEQEETQEQEKTQGSRAGLGQEEHLFIGGSEGRIIKVVLNDYEDYTEPTLRVHNLSGVQMFAAPIEEALSTFSLNQLPPGIYVVSLTLNGERETKKVYLQ